MYFWQQIVCCSICRIKSENCTPPRFGRWISTSVPSDNPPMPRYTGLLPVLLVKAIKYLLIQLSTLESKIDPALKLIDGALRVRVVFFAFFQQTNYIQERNGEHLKIRMMVLTKSLPKKFKPLPLVHILEIYIWNNSLLNIPVILMPQHCCILVHTYMFTWLTSGDSLCLFWQLTTWLTWGDWDGIYYRVWRRRRFKGRH